MNSNRAYFTQKIRQGSGYFLAFFVFTHLLTHSTGMFGIEFMEKAQDVFRGFWRFLPVSILLYTILITHVILSISKNVKRKSFKGIPGREWLQIILGFIIPTVLIGHIIASRYLYTFHDVNLRYTVVLYELDALHYFLYGFLLTVVSIHTFIGIHNNIMLKPYYPKIKQLVTVSFIILPLFVIFGTEIAHKEVMFRYGANPEIIQDIMRKINPENMDYLNFSIIYGILWGIVYLLIILILFSGRFLYLKWKNSLRSIRVYYPDGKESVIFDGASLLDASLMAGIPHAHICGGRGRCSTCRIRIDEGMENIAEPSDEEIKVLSRIGASKNVRLACQVFPSKNIKIHPILHGNVSADAGFAQKAYMFGSDWNTVMLFADIRGFTKFSENKLPYDVVFVLNEYFKIMGESIEKSGGYLDKFIGDGTMALFGIEKSIKQGCLDSLHAAYQISIKLKALNLHLQHELKEPLKIGIGLHLGNVIVGKMGYKHTNHLTAIGDAVNTASRLESATKDFDAQLIVSGEVAEKSALDFSKYEKKKVIIRGKEEEIEIYIIPDAESLESILPAPLKI